MTGSAVHDVGRFVGAVEQVIAAAAANPVPPTAAANPIPPAAAADPVVAWGPVDVVARSTPDHCVDALAP